MSIMVISCKRVSVSAGHHAHAPTKWVWYLGGAKIELCYSVGQLCAASSRSVFDFIAVVTQFRLPISEHVAKIRFAVHGCDLHPFYSCCMCRHALNKLDSSASLRLAPQYTAFSSILSIHFGASVSSAAVC